MKTSLEDEISLEEETFKETSPELITTTLNNENKISEDNLEDPILNYETCNDITIDKNCPLHEKSTVELSQAITQIVNIEGPIHINEVIKRIRLLWGLKKAGKRIKDNITSAVIVAEQNNALEKATRC